MVNLATATAAVVVIEEVPGVEASVTAAADSAKVAAVDSAVKVTEASEVVTETVTVSAAVTEVANVEVAVVATDLAVAAVVVFPDLEVEVSEETVSMAQGTVVTDSEVDLLVQEIKTVAIGVDSAADREVVPEVDPEEAVILAGDHSAVEAAEVKVAVDLHFRRAHIFLCTFVISSIICSQRIDSST